MTNKYTEEDEYSIISHLSPFVAIENNKNNNNDNINNDNIYDGNNDSNNSIIIMGEKPTYTTYEIKSFDKNKEYIIKQQQQQQQLKSDDGSITIVSGSDDDCIYMQRKPFISCNKRKNNQETNNNSLININHDDKEGVHSSSSLLYASDLSVSFKDLLEIEKRTKIMDNVHNIVPSLSADKKSQQMLQESFLLRQSKQGQELQEPQHQQQQNYIVSHQALRECDDLICATKEKIERSLTIASSLIAMQHDSYLQKNSKQDQHQKININTNDKDNDRINNDDDDKEKLECMHGDSNCQSTTKTSKSLQTGKKKAEIMTTMTSDCSHHHQATTTTTKSNYLHHFVVFTNAGLLLLLLMLCYPPFFWTNKMEANNDSLSPSLPSIMVRQQQKLQRLFFLERNNNNDFIFAIATNMNDDEKHYKMIASDTTTVSKKEISVASVLVKTSNDQNSNNDDIQEDKDDREEKEEDLINNIHTKLRKRRATTENQKTIEATKKMLNINNDSDEDGTSTVAVASGYEFSVSTTLDGNSVEHNENSKHFLENYDNKDIDNFISILLDHNLSQKILEYNNLVKSQTNHNSKNNKINHIFQYKKEESNNDGHSNGKKFDNSTHNVFYTRSSNTVNIDNGIKYDERFSVVPQSIGRWEMNQKKGNEREKMLILAAATKGEKIGAMHILLRFLYYIIEDRFAFLFLGGEICGAAIFITFTITLAGIITIYKLYNALFSFVNQTHILENGDATQQQRRQQQQETITVKKETADNTKKKNRSTKVTHPPKYVPKLSSLANRTKKTVKSLLYSSNHGNIDMGSTDTDTSNCISSIVNFYDLSNYVRLTKIKIIDVMYHRGIINSSSYSPLKKNQLIHTLMIDYYKEYKEHSYLQLQINCKKRGLKQNGRRDIVIQRLIESGP